MPSDSAKSCSVKQDVQASPRQSVSTTFLRMAAPSSVATSQWITCVRHITHIAHVVVQVLSASDSEVDARRPDVSHNIQIVQGSHVCYKSSPVAPGHNPMCGSCWIRVLGFV